MLIWEDASAGVRVRFGGKEASQGGKEQFVAPRSASWVQQVHSADALTARRGCAGEGDALTTEERGLALIVATADCVPVLVQADGMVAAIHAGWRGLAAGVIEAAVGTLRSPSRAWVGPHIGPCCYEVSEEVAERVVAAAGAEVRVSTGGERPHLDLGFAARAQLRALGVADVRMVGPCTRCDERLWSYRRDGAVAGRNYSAIWRSPGGI